MSQSTTPRSTWSNAFLPFSVRRWRILRSSAWMTTQLMALQRFSSGSQRRTGAFGFFRAPVLVPVEQGTSVSHPPKASTSPSLMLTISLSPTCWSPPLLRPRRTRVTSLYTEAGSTTQRAKPTVRQSGNFKLRDCLRSDLLRRQRSATAFLTSLATRRGTSCSAHRVFRRRDYISRRLVEQMTCTSHAPL